MKAIKGWAYRHQLFSRFDHGVQFDKEGFECSKSESVALFIARHLPGKTVLDAFTGIGGCAIAFAREGKHVISVEINDERSRMAQNNAVVYGVESQINFVVGDLIKLWRKFDFDAAYFDPSWGGLGYENLASLNFSSFKPNVLHLIKKLTDLGKSVAITLPLNFDLNELKRIKKGAHLHFNEQYGKPYCIHCIWVAAPEIIDAQDQEMDRGAVARAPDHSLNRARQKQRTGCASLCAATHRSYVTTTAVEL